jgi:arylsulfatase
MAEDTWELYDTRSDFSLANDLAAKNPSKLKELQAVFLAEAGKHQVLPLDDRTLERIDGTQVVAAPTRWGLAPHCPSPMA